MIKWIRHRLWEHRRRKFCKLNEFFCPECVYHKWVWIGAVFRGNRCLYPKGGFAEYTPQDLTHEQRENIKKNMKAIEEKYRENMSIRN